MRKGRGRTKYSKLRSARRTRRLPLDRLERRARIRQFFEEYGTERLSSFAKKVFDV